MSENVATLEARIGELLKTRKYMVAVAESCTGGLIMHRLTNIAGSSEYFPGGVVSYGDAAKIGLLNVSEEDLAHHGAVSETVATQMARGVRTLFITQIGLAVTGIAGPGGGTPDKPVGLTYICMAALDTLKVVKHVWTGNREENKASSADAALQLLYNFLAGKEG